MSENPNTQSGAERLAKELDIESISWEKEYGYDADCSFRRAATAIRALAEECEAWRKLHAAVEAKQKAAWGGSKLLIDAADDEVQSKFVDIKAIRAATDALNLLENSNAK